MALHDKLAALLGRGWRIDGVIAHVNDESDAWLWSYGADKLYPPDTLFFHVDTTVNKLKAMIYLSDEVTVENGAFGYVPGSHHAGREMPDLAVRRAIRMSDLYMRDAQTRRQFAALPTYLQQKNDIGSELPPGCTQSEVLAQSVRRFSSDAARFILFDPLGVHVGGVVRRGRREALQLVLGAG